MNKRNTLKKLNVYFQMENDESKKAYSRLENVAKITGWSVSAVAGLAVRMAITQVEEALIEPEQLLKLRKKNAKTN